MTALPVDDMHEEQQWIDVTIRNKDDRRQEKVKYSAKGFRKGTNAPPPLAKKGQLHGNIIIYCNWSRSAEFYEPQPNNGWRLEQQQCRVIKPNCSIPPLQKNRTTRGTGVVVVTCWRKL